MGSVDFLGMTLRVSVTGAGCDMIMTGCLLHFVKSIISIENNAIIEINRVVFSNPIKFMPQIQFHNLLKSFAILWNGQHKAFQIVVHIEGCFCFLFVALRVLRTLRAAALTCLFVDIINLFLFYFVINIHQGDSLSSVLLIFCFDFFMCCFILFVMKLCCFVFLLLLSGCMTVWRAPDDFVLNDVVAPDFIIRTYQKDSSDTSPVHIYIEGDGFAFSTYGIPTSNPTPRNSFLRELAASDRNANVVYIARPCQYIMSSECTVSDWTDGRFSGRIIDNMAFVVRKVSGGRPIVLIGYSGGALVSGLMIADNHDLDVRQWITIAGVLNHSDWTRYFGDSPLVKSQDLSVLPNVQQSHFVASDDVVVPLELSQRWTRDVGGVIIVPNSTHASFQKFNLF